MDGVSVCVSDMTFLPLEAPARRDFVRGLDEIGPDDAGLVGGKAFPLAALLRNGFCVPRGFCVTTDAFRARLGGDLPEDLRDDLAEAWRRSGFRMAAVRSSATEEDGRETSWAGVFPTVLPVRDADEMIAAVQNCFRALHAPEAEFLRAHGRRSARPAMAVLVQELIEAEAAGIVFTAHPVTGARGEIVINAIRGLGEPLASGRVNGDTFVVAARDGAIRSHVVSDQAFMLTSRGPVALEEAKPALTHAQAQKLARLAVEVEDVFNCPQDIEFAIAEGRIHLLQARPITAVDRETVGEGEIAAYLEHERTRLKKTVAALRRQGFLTGERAIFSSGNIGELLPTPTPMSFGLFRTIFAGPGGAIAAGRQKLGYALAADAAEPLYEKIGGQPFFNVEIDAKTFCIGAPVEVDDILDSIAREPGRASYPEFGLYTQGLSLDEARARHGEAEGFARHAAFWRFHDGMRRAARDLLRRRAQDEADWALALEPPRSDEIDGSAEKLLAALQRRLDRLRKLCVDFVMAARVAFFFADLVRWRLRRHLGDDRLIGELLMGLDGSMVTQQAFDLEKLAKGEIARETFLAAYGHCAANELEISLPRFAEEPLVLDRLLRDLSASGRRPAAEFRRQQRQRRAAQREVRRRLAEVGVANVEIRDFFADLRLAQKFLPRRETAKHFYTGDYRGLRAVLLELNARLGWAEGDVFYLEPEEIGGALARPDAFAPLVCARRRERKIAARLAAQRRIPAVIFADALDKIGARAEAATSTAFVGAPVAPGAVVGRVMLLDEGVTGAPPGCCRERILVAHSANLGLAPWLRVAAGLVVEVGGVLAHAACQAREAGVPALVLEGATSLLRDGMLVSLDGETGRLEILEST
ncbi:pyruvate,water dikinase [Rhodoblastus acidophilus]|uniref:PEP/pyruvate-binding domain-containing protein n=1 Tax=Rhodoblastus acidophilus TaxID=1074 RepID=UPI00222585BD|nr:PEP/pyruvate-binding domain-containing protein [Rhodoblastus acidophilus]MCW2284117.1 pyruvate,water dikinase [Rhodoblastus acidophilus]MCW2332813.1 pyruvate,water dikinase [Rhodoblastus acidophilus]